MRYSIAEKSTMSCFRCTTLSNGRYRRGTAFPLHSRGCRCVEEGGGMGWMVGGVGGMGGGVGGMVGGVGGMGGGVGGMGGEEGGWEEGGAMGGWELGWDEKRRI